MMSFTTTVRVEVLTPSAVTALGLAVKVVVVLTGAPGKKVTVVFSAVPSTVAVTVFIAAWVDASVVVNTPEVFVEPDTGENTLKVPVALMVTGAPCTGALLPLRTVTVMVVVVVPSDASVLGLATMDELPTLITGAVKVTLVLAVSVPATKAEMVSVCTVIEDSVLLKCPDALVLPEGGVNVLFPPLADMATD